MTFTPDQIAHFQRWIAPKMIERGTAGAIEIAAAQYRLDYGRGFQEAPMSDKRRMMLVALKAMMCEVPDAGGEFVLD